MASQSHALYCNAGVVQQRVHEQTQIQPPSTPSTPAQAAAKVMTSSLPSIKTGVARARPSSLACVDWSRSGSPLASHAREARHAGQGAPWYCRAFCPTTSCTTQRPAPRCGAAVTARRCVLLTSWPQSEPPPGYTDAVFAAIAATSAKPTPCTPKPQPWRR